MIVEVFKAKRTELQFPRCEMDHWIDLMTFQNPKKLAEVVIGAVASSGLMSRDTIYLQLSVCSRQNIKAALHCSVVVSNDFQEKSQLQLFCLLWQARASFPP